MPHVKTTHCTKMLLFCILSRRIGIVFSAFTPPPIYIIYALIINCLRSLLGGNYAQHYAGLIFIFLSFFIGKKTGFFV